MPPYVIRRPGRPRVAQPVVLPVVVEPEPPRRRNLRAEVLEAFREARYGRT